MKTFYFGRYQLEVPTDGSDIWSSYQVAEEGIELLSKIGNRDLTNYRRSHAGDGTVPVYSSASPRE